MGRVANAAADNVLDAIRMRMQMTGKNLPDGVEIRADDHGFRCALGLREVVDITLQLLRKETAQPVGESADAITR